MSDPYIANVSLLLHLDGSLTDTSSYAHAVSTTGSAALTSSDSKFGSGSLTGSHAVNSFISVPIVSSAEMDITTGDFTLEFWMKYTGVVAYILDTSNASALGGMFMSCNAGGIVRAFIDDGSGVFNTTVPGITLTLNVWGHVALVKSGANIQLYGDGVGGGPTLYPAAVVGTLFRLGGVGSAIGGQGLGGFIDEIRLTKGVARYTSNFTPPAAPFDDYVAGSFGGTVYGKLAPGLVYPPIVSANLGDAHPRVWQPYENLTVKVPK